MKDSRSLRRVAVATVAVALLASACGDNDDASTSDTTPQSDEDDTAAADEEVGGEPDEEVGGEPVDLSLTYATYGGEGVTVSQALTYWFDLIDDSDAVNLEYEPFWSQSLLGATEILSGVASGRADTGLTSNLYHPADFPLTNLIDVPFVVNNPEASARAMRELYQDYEPFRQEWHDNGVHLLGVGLFANNVILSPEPITELSELSGMRIRSGGYLTDALEAVGVNTVAISQPEVYEALERGVLDATTIVTVDLGVSFSFIEVAPHILDTRSGLVTQTYQVMDLDLWESLSPEVQAVFDDTHDEYIQRLVEITMDQETEACDAFIEVGSVNRLSDEDLETWQGQVADQVLETWRAASGPNGDEFYERFIETYDRYAAEATYEPVIERCG